MLFRTLYTVARVSLTWVLGILVRVLFVIYSTSAKTISPLHYFRELYNADRLPVSFQGHAT